MSSESLDVLRAARTVSAGSGINYNGVTERRKRVRTRLHWAVFLFRESPVEVVAESVTRDLSSNGFYCTSAAPVGVGERFRCSIRVPTHDPRHKQLERTLDCRVRVMRVVPQETGGFGVACQIEDYQLSVPG
jgi:hypothetical protein